MDIVTLMDYDDPVGVAMCKAWIYLAKRFNPDANITVYHGERIAEIREFGKRFPNITFTKLDTTDILSHKHSKGFRAFSQDFILAIWRLLTNKQSKLFFIEADAWILGSLDDWWNIADEKPYIAVVERTLKNGHQLINTGTWSYNSSNFMSYEKLLDRYHKDGKIKYPVGEQGLMNSWLEYTGYDCIHPSIGFEYNCFAADCKIERADDDAIIVRSGDSPTHAKSKKLNWKWWGHNRVVKILHAFYLKFWELPECKPLWDYCAAKVQEIEK